MPEIDSGDKSVAFGGLSKEENAAYDRAKSYMDREHPQPRRTSGEAAGIAAAIAVVILGVYMALLAADIHAELAFVIVLVLAAGVAFLDSRQAWRSYSQRFDAVLRREGFPVGSPDPMAANPGGSATIEHFAIPDEPKPQRKKIWHPDGHWVEVSARTPDDLYERLAPPGTARPRPHRP